MTNIVRFRVDGLPITQGSKNSFVNKRTGRVNMVETRHNELQVWRQRIALMWKQQHTPIIAGVVSITLRFFLPRPKAHFGTGRNAGKLKDWAPYYVGVKPDIDKLERAILDGLTIAGAIEDDARVAILNTQKIYADITDRQGVDITIATLD